MELGTESLDELEKRRPPKRPVVKDAKDILDLWTMFQSAHEPLTLLVTDDKRDF